MKILKTFLVFLLLLPFPNHTNGINVKEVANIAVNVIRLSLQFSKEIRAWNDFNEIQKFRTELNTNINKLHDKLDFVVQEVEKLTELIEKQTQDILITPSINQIKSCVIELNSLLQNPNNTAARENFLSRCSDIIVKVRTIYDFLSGQNSSILEKYRHKDGSCNGQSIKTMHNFLYRYLVDGCAISVTAEELRHNQNSVLDKNECLNMVEKTNDFMENLYNKCISSSCQNFYSHATELLSGPEIVDVESAASILNDNFPWFQLFIVESKYSNSIIENNGTFAINIKTFTMQKNYIVIWTNSFVSFFKHNNTENAFIVNVTISICDHVRSWNGMNLSRHLYEEEKLYSFVGYTSDHTNDTCRYTQRLDPPLSASSKQELTLITFLFVLFALYFL